MAVCLTNAEFERLLAETMDSGQQERAGRHLDSCNACRERRTVFAARQEDLIREARALGTRETRVPEPPSTLSNLPGPVGATLDAGSPDLPQAAIEGYEVLRELNRGGQGVVYQAIQKSTKREVAIKVMLEGPFASAMTKRRFEREIELVASLHHPNIVAVFDSGVSHGKYWYAMDYIRGMPLDAFVAAQSMSIDDILRLFAKVCDAVSYAHQHGVIHRDLKPGNVFVDERGEPRVLDFGLAKIAGTEAVGDSRPMLVSVTGQVVGTLPYMSPEQTRGNPDEIDIRTDVYSLGVLLYELLTGKYPYDVSGQMAETLRNIAETEPLRPSSIRRQINNEVETIVLKALAKEPARRYQSAGNLGADVHHFLAGEPIEAKRDSSFYMLRKSLRRYRVPVAITALVTVLVLAIAIVAVVYQRRLTVDRAERLALIMDKCNTSILLMQADDVDQNLDEALALGIDPSVYHCFRGWAHGLRLDWELAMEEANKALELDETNAPAYYLRAGLHAKDSAWVKAAADAGKAGKCDGGTELEVAVRGLIQILRQDYDGGLKELRNLRDRLEGKPVGVWMYGFGLWYRVLRDPPADLERRRQWAREALEEIDTAKKLLRIPFIHDVRADLCYRLALIAKAMGKPDLARQHLESAAEDARHLVNNEAAAPGHIHLTVYALLAGDLEAAADHADRAYREAFRSDSARSFNSDQARKTAIGLRVWCNFLHGDDSSQTLRLARQLEARHQDMVHAFEVGVVHGILLDPAELIDDRRDMGDPSKQDHEYGLWVGALARGDRALANRVARRFSVSFVDQLKAWNRTFLGFIQGRSTAQALIEAAGDEAHRLDRALLAIAMKAPTRAERIAGLQEVINVANLDRIFLCAHGFLLRCRQDPEFLRDRRAADTGGDTDRAPRRADG